MSLPAVRRRMQGNIGLTYIFIYNSNSIEGIHTQGSNGSSFQRKIHWIENEVFKSFEDSNWNYHFHLGFHSAFQERDTTTNINIQNGLSWIYKMVYQDVVNVPADIRKLFNILLNQALLIFIPFRLVFGRLYKVDGFPGGSATPSSCCDHNFLNFPVAFISAHIN